jgi:High potential iron-sulfur protein
MALAAASLASLATARSRAADMPLLSESDPAAKAVKYVEDATKVSEAMGNRCDTCALWQAASGATEGTCTLFKGKLVKAAGWCTSWAPQI